MGFKDIIKNDNRTTFINALEFADQHYLNGVQCLAIVQNVRTDEAGLDKSDLVTASGVYGETLQVNCVATDLKEKPVSGQGFELDNALYQVEKVYDDMGILSIFLVGYDR